MSTSSYYNFKSGQKEVGKNGKVRYVPKGLPNLLTKQEIVSQKIDPSKDYYVSIYQYNDQHKKLINDNKSAAGIDDVVTDTLVWDFDSKDLEKCRKAVLDLGTILVDKYKVDPDNIKCYFSGGKGFHVVLKIDRNINVKQFKKVVNEIGGHIETFDPMIFDHARLLRHENTKHLITNLYKIPFHIAEVDELNIDQIKELAKAPRDFEFPHTPVTLPDSLYLVPKTKEVPVTNFTEEEFSYDNPPRGWKKYKYALAQGWFDEGERHNALMVIAATCRGLGYNKDQAYFLCKSALKKQAKRTGEDEFDKSELYKNIIEESVYSDKWKGGQYSPQENPWLKKYCEEMGFEIEKEEIDQVVQLHNIEEEFIDFVINIDKNTVLTGIPELDKAVPLTVGMNCGIIGAPSSGKTALSLKILKNTSDAGVLSVFASLDMRRNRLYEKLLYRVSGLSRDELYSRIKNGQAGPIFEQVRKEYANVFFYDRSCPSVEDIRRYITSVEEKTGKKVKLVMIDYFERVNADRSDETAASKEVAGKLQDLVNDLNVCLITLVQPNKFSLSAGPDSPILNYTSIKGSSYLYQAFRSIISIWRPFYTPELKENDKYLQMAILKNDLGELDMFNFGWEGKRGEIWGLAEEGEEELARLLKIKADSKNKVQDASGDWG